MNGTTFVSNLMEFKLDFSPEAWCPETWVRPIFRANFTDGFVSQRKLVTPAVRLLGPNTY